MAKPALALSRKIIAMAQKQVNEPQNSLSIDKILRIPPVFIEHYSKLKNNYKYLIISGGRASTKTQSTATFLLNESDNPENSNMIFLRHIYSY
jgi:hypothetical protein